MIFFRTILIIIFASLVIALPLQAELYKWVDDKGNIFYGDKPPENVELKKITGNISSVETVKVEPSNLIQT